ncbi:MAG: FAD-dependent oxidoreductase [Pseudomonadota bacterium]
MERRILIVIGAGAAGIKAASKAKRENQEMDVKIFTKERYITYAGLLLSYYVGGIIRDKQELLVRSPEEFKNEQGIDIYVEHEVKKINAKEKTITIESLKSGKRAEYPYDKLIIATGASPVMPSFENIGLKNIFTLGTVSDAFAIRELVDSGKVGKAVIAGGGLAGLKAAENLRHRGLDVTVVELLPHILSSFDEEIALYAQKYMVDKGVGILTGEKVTGFIGSDGKLTKVKTSAGDIEADLAILSLGAKPNTGIAADAGIELGASKAIKVNKYMETSIKDIYAAGDCAEDVDLITGKPVWYPMGPTASKTGRIAGCNAALGPGQDELRESLEGVLGTTIERLFEINAAKTGLSERDAIKEGYDTETVLVPANDRDFYFPGYKQIITKLVVDRKTRRVIGAQAVGEGVVDKPIDIIATAITLGAKVDDLTKLDLSYAPQFSTAISSTMLTGNVMMGKLAGRVQTVKAPEVPQLLREEKVNILDVREEEEFFISAIPGASNIPMNELEYRLAEIDRDRETLILVCTLGKRAFLTYQKLKWLGFTNIKILEGGTTAYPYELV